MLLPISPLKEAHVKVCVLLDPKIVAFYSMSTAQYYISKKRLKGLLFLFITTQSVLFEVYKPAMVFPGKS